MQKYLPSNESKQHTKQLKSGSKTIVKLWRGFLCIKTEAEMGRPWLARPDYGWQVLVWMWLWTSCPLPGPRVLPQARTFARGRAGIFTSCSTRGSLKPLLSVCPFFFFAHHLLFIIQHVLAPSIFCSSPCLSKSFLCLFIWLVLTSSDRFSILSIDSPHLQSSFVFPLYILE